MSPFSLFRLRVRTASLVSICVVFIVASLAWASRQQAGSASRQSGTLSAEVWAADKGGVTTEAATIVVNSLADVSNPTDGLCTLREAITAANTDTASGATPGECNAGSGSDTVNFSVTGTITLTSVLNNISTNISIAGPGANQLTISGNNARRVFQINSGGVVNISDITLANGNGTCCQEIDGGVINNKGTLTLTRVNLFGNTAFGNGGALYNSGPNNSVTMTLESCVIGGPGAGQANTNTINGNGAGLYNASGRVFINNTTFSNNSTPNWGGAIMNRGDVEITNSTISGNTANVGSGIYTSNSGALVNTTVSGNHTGNAIENTDFGFINLINCTVTLNDGYGINTSSPSNDLVTNTIIAGNTGITDVNGTNFFSGGGNLIGRSSGGNGFVNGSNGDQVGSIASPLDPHLGPLADNGGSTKTHALLSSSTALDAGRNCVTQSPPCEQQLATALLTDQRGMNRKVDGPDGDTTATVDIGAYEMQTPLASLPDTSTNEDTQLTVSFDGGDPNTISSVTATSSNTTLVPNDPAHLGVTMTGTTGLITINPATNENGTTNITVTINRTVGGPDVKTFILTVNAVNDAPSFTKGADQTVFEDASAQTVSHWATSISPGGGSDESGQILTFQIANNSNAALFSVAPAISSDGTLTYTPAANANGSSTITINLKDNGGTANGGSDTSASQSFTITVNAVNDAPSFTKGADQTVNEDAGAQAVTNWATAISRGPADESGQILTFQVTNNTNAPLFSAGPAISSTGTLTYTPAANANGSATVTINLKDSGGTANGGIDTSASQTFTITVNAINDAPSFTKGANQTVNEDAAAQTVNNWATSLSAGPANESGQALSFQITNNTNSALFSAGPVVSSTGTLTYTPAANANGSATITLAIKDDGGTANGGVDTSASQSFTITVNVVNDAPSFTKGADQTVNNNAGTQTVANWATNILRGPSDESGQTLTFQITGNSNSGLFTAGPAVSSSGTLTYTPSSSAGGTATITINLKDSGGTANGGVDTSASQTFTITVVPVGGFVSFASSTGNTTENSGSTTMNVTRSGDTSQAMTVNYATNADSGVPCSTANGVASPKCDFTAALGTLSYAAGETSKSITILISQDSFVEGPEAITLTLSNPTGGAALGTPSSMSVTIADDATEPPGNIIDDANTFVRMHYHDFLNREGDQSGIGFWTGQMTNCGASDLLVCRVNVSGAFFLSIEFQQTGYLVERMYRTAYGQATATSNLGGSHQVLVPIVRANEFLTDTQRIGRGVIVLQPGWETVLENNKQAYALEFVQTTRFITALPTSRTPAQFVDQLNQNAGLVLSPSERTTAINTFGIAADTTNVTARAQVLRQIAEDQDLYNAEFSRAFVLAQYIGYLRRNPNDAPESSLDYTGYEFWLNKLAENGGDYVKAEMVKAFISSDEYRKRFGP
jgi:CSLREA domain-containing protein